MCGWWRCVYTLAGKSMVVVVEGAKVAVEYQLDE
jgi:hypothetical protein